MPDRAGRTLPPHVLIIQNRGKTGLATKNLTPGLQVYGERLINVSGSEYRLWSPRRSKLASMIEKKLGIPIHRDSRVLYLGGAAGTTASHVSDIADNGRIFIVEFSARAVHDLVKVCATRKNMVPILGDAARPALYRAVVDKVDVIYQDVAQPDQAGIALANAGEFLGPGGYLIMVIKARSVNSTMNPKRIYQQELQKLEEAFEVLETGELKPFHRDHLAAVLKYHRNP